MRRWLMVATLVQRGRTLVGLDAGDDVEWEDGMRITWDDIDRDQWDQVTRSSWQYDPEMALRWAILEQWIWEYLRGRAEMDVESMRDLVEYFPKLPSDLPERLVRRREQMVSKVDRRTKHCNTRGWRYKAIT
jgi:hypothetical protein